MGSAFKNIKQIRLSRNYEEDSEFRLVTQALWAGLVGYLAGSCFASTEYNLYPYFMIGYTCAMIRIIGTTPGSPVKDKNPGLRKFAYIGERRPQMIGSR
jgi:hypothetical protein